MYCISQFKTLQWPVKRDRVEKKRLSSNFYFSWGQICTTRVCVCGKCGCFLERVFNFFFFFFTLNHFFPPLSNFFGRIITDSFLVVLFRRTILYLPAPFVLLFCNIHTFLYFTSSFQVQHSTPWVEIWIFNEFWAQNCQQACVSCVS